MALLIAAFVWVAWSFARPAFEGSPDRPWGSVVLFTVCWLALGALSVGGFLISLGTRLDRTAASQLSLRGRVVIRWTDVVSVEHAPVGKLILSDGRQKITISSIMYPDATKLYDWIEDQLRAAGAPARYGSSR